MTDAAFFAIAGGIAAAIAYLVGHYQGCKCGCISQWRARCEREGYDGYDGY